MASHHKTPRSANKIISEITRKQGLTIEEGTKTKVWTNVVVASLGNSTDDSHFWEPGNLGFSNHKQKLRPWDCMNLWLNFPWINLSPLTYYIICKRAEWKVEGLAHWHRKQRSLSFSTWGVGERKKYSQRNYNHKPAVIQSYSLNLYYQQQ